ncbi:MAG: hypothetical protein IPG06_22210 [Haliea sp.]|nr:hypothetical protein [Haliea sp.]
MQADATEPALPKHTPNWLTAHATHTTHTTAAEKLQLRVSPSAIVPSETARIGEVITLGERLPIEANVNRYELGTALHAVIGTLLSVQHDTARVLRDHGMEKTLSIAAAEESANRLLAVINARFAPIKIHMEYPIHYTNDNGQIIAGWIDCCQRPPGSCDRSQSIAARALPLGGALGFQDN